MTTHVQSQIPQMISIIVFEITSRPSLWSSSLGNDGSSRDSKSRSGGKDGDDGAEGRHCRLFDFLVGVGRGRGDLLVGLLVGCCVCELLVKAGSVSICSLLERNEKDRVFWFVGGKVGCWIGLVDRWFDWID